MSRPDVLPAVAALAAVLLAGLSSAATPARAQESASDTAGVLEAARAMLEGITTGDTELLRSVTAPDLRMEGTTTRGSLPPTAAGQTREEFLAVVARPDADLFERMWDPTVRIHGRVADVLAPYDFYQDGELSHCGVDLFQLVKTSDGWVVVSVIWTVEQPPACERHPDGPPPWPDGS
jgi:hypothetical protein